MNLYLILFNVLFISTLLASEPQQPSMFAQIRGFLRLFQLSSLATPLIGKPKDSQNGRNAVKPSDELNRLENGDTVFVQKTPPTASIIMKEGITTFAKINHSTTEGRDTRKYVALEKIIETNNTGQSCCETVFGNCFGRRKK